LILLILRVALQPGRVSSAAIDEILAHLARRESGAAAPAAEHSPQAGVGALTREFHPARRASWLDPLKAIRYE
jgi:hypothetical protein